MAEEQQSSIYNNGENIIPPEEVASFLPKTVEEGNSNSRYNHCQISHTN